MRRLVLPTFLLAGVYLLTLASADPVDAATGLLLGAGLLLAFRGHLFSGPAAPLRELPLRLLRAALLAAVVLRDITVGTWQVTLVVLHLRPLTSPGIVVVPIGERTPLGTAATSLLSTLAPGEFLVDVDPERGVMLVHVLDASDPAEVRVRFAHFYERWQRPVLP